MIAEIMQSPAEVMEQSPADVQGDKSDYESEGEEEGEVENGPDNEDHINGKLLIMPDAEEE